MLTNIPNIYFSLTWPGILTMIKIFLHNYNNNTSSNMSCSRSQNTNNNNVVVGDILITMMIIIFDNRNWRRKRKKKIRWDQLRKRNHWIRREPNVSFSKILLWFIISVKDKITQDKNKTKKNSITKHFLWCLSAFKQNHMSIKALVNWLWWPNTNWRFFALSGKSYIYGALLSTPFIVTSKISMCPRHKLILFYIINII